MLAAVAATVPWGSLSLSSFLSLLQHRGEGAVQGGAATPGNKAAVSAPGGRAAKSLGCFLAHAKVICLENQRLSFALSIPVRKGNRRVDLLRPAERGKP